MKKTVTGPAFQGDLMIIPCDPPADLPKGAAKPDGGHHVVAHSETGHHHTIAAKAAKVYMVTAMLSYLHVRQQVELKHHRPHDQHEPLTLPPGWYKMLRQREGAPDGWRQVAD